MATAESNRKGEENPAPEIIPLELLGWSFFPRGYLDPFSLGDAVLFHAMRHLIAKLFSHA